jgi:predicted PurR-regulated permease PerM
MNICARPTSAAPTCRWCDFAGVIGGLLGFGLVGLFVGPVVLAVAYTQLAAWVSEGSPAAT